MYVLINIIKIGITMVNQSIKTNSTYIIQTEFNTRKNSLRRQYTAIQYQTLCPSDSDNNSDEIDVSFVLTKYGWL